MNITFTMKNLSGDFWKSFNSTTVCNQYGRMMSLVDFTGHCVCIVIDGVTLCSGNNSSAMHNRGLGWMPEERAAACTLKLTKVNRNCKSASFTF